jgi:aldehyde dehydrogenase (NAD+)
LDAVYDAFRERLVQAAATVDPQPVISRESMERTLQAVARAQAAGATVLAGGRRLDLPGWYLAPTVIEGAAPDDSISRTELFGPVTVLYRTPTLDAAIALVNDSPYGLTAAIHTASVHRAMRFADKAQAGVVVVNAGTHGSEPHMGFGGVKDSGTGWREAGIESLDVYSDPKVVNLVVDPAKT